MTERQRIIEITLFAKTIDDTSIVDLAKRGSIPALAAITAGMQNDLKGCVRASTQAIREAFPGRTVEFIENQMALIFNDKPTIVM